MSIITRYFLNYTMPCAVFFAFALVGAHNIMGDWSLLHRVALCVCGGFLMGIWKSIK